MSKAKKSPKVQYGIEITKPWSKDMYEHNEKVSEEMKQNIHAKWCALIYKIDKDLDWSEIEEDTSIVKLQKGVCFSGYGDG